MPPELLVGTDLRIDVFKSVYLLPSLMHRLESLMLASQLREEISQHIGNFNIASSMVHTEPLYIYITISLVVLHLWSLIEFMYNLDSGSSHYSTMLRKFLHGATGIAWRLGFEI